MARRKQPPAEVDVDRRVVRRKKPADLAGGETKGLVRRETVGDEPLEAREKPVEARVVTLKPVGVSEDGSWIMLAGSRSKSRFRVAIDDELVGRLEEARERAEPPSRQRPAREQARSGQDVFEPPLDELLDFTEEAEPEPHARHVRVLEPERRSSLPPSVGEPRRDTKERQAEREASTEEPERASGREPRRRPLQFQAPPGEPEPEESRARAPATEPGAAPVEAGRNAEARGVSAPVEEARSRHESEPRQGEAPAEGESKPRSPALRVESKLSIKEIQQRLRRGRAVATIAKEAGVPREWIERFEAPIVWERANIAERAKRLTLTRSRKGPSGAPLGGAVEANIKKRRLPIQADELSQHWDAIKESRRNTWKVRFSFTSRGRNRVAEWRYDPESDELRALNELATELGWIAPRRGKAAG